jgi:hypothetical protein
LTQNNSDIISFTVEAWIHACPKRRGCWDSAKHWKLHTVSHPRRLACSYIGCAVSPAYILFHRHG